MATRSVSVPTIFGWIPETFSLIGRALPSFAGASVLTIVLAFVLMAPVLFVFGVAGLDPAALEGAQLAAMVGKLLAAYGLMMLMSLVLYPPLMLGWSRLCQRVDRGVGGSAFEIFSPYRDSQVWLRAVGLMLVMALLMLVLLGIFAAALWGSIMQFAQLSAVQRAGGTPQLPAGMGALVLGYFVFLAAMLAVQWIQLVAFAEVALRPTGVFQALGLAAAAVGRNFLKLFLVAFCVGIVLLVVAVVVGIVMALLISALSLVGGLGTTIAMLLFEVPLMFALYPLMFGGGYVMWKSLVGDDAAVDVLPDDGSSFAA